MNEQVDTRAETMMIPMQISDTQYNLILILSPKSVERSQAGTPFERCMNTIPGDFHRLCLNRLLVCTPSEDDMREIFLLETKIASDKALLAGIVDILLKNAKYDVSQGDGKDVYNIRSPQHKVPPKH